MSQHEQPELPLEWPEYHSYKIELRKGAVHDLEVIRAHEVTDVIDAESMIEGIRDTVQGRDDVTWNGEEVDEHGYLYGLAPGGVVFQIHVTPPLNVALS